jgi:DNA-binding CsgD family transcriptional regulator
MGANPRAKHSGADRRVQLKPRQLESSRMVGDGLSAKEIAARLDLSPKTMDFHRSDIYRAVGVDTTVLLVR